MKLENPLMQGAVLLGMRHRSLRIIHVVNGQVPISWSGRTCYQRDELVCRYEMTAKKLNAQGSLTQPIKTECVGSASERAVPLLIFQSAGATLSWLPPLIPTTILVTTLSLLLSAVPHVVSRAGSPFLDWTCVFGEQQWPQSAGPSKGTMGEVSRKIFQGIVSKMADADDPHFT